MAIVEIIILIISIILLVWVVCKIGYKYGFQDGWHKAFCKIQVEIRNGNDIACSFTFRWLYTDRISNTEFVTNVKYDQNQLNKMLSEYGKDRLEEDIHRALHEREYGEEYEEL